MPDREKVIKALEHCKDNQHVFDCHECDYGGKTGTFCIRVIDDAIALLKEYETIFEKDGHHIRCTNCGNYWCDTGREGNLFPHNYCPECGRGVKCDA